MSSNLRIDWATAEAVKFACIRWHYSRCVPPGKAVRVGVWEFGKFIGVVLFSRGANHHMLKPYRLQQTQGCELTRIALGAHTCPVTRIVRIALGFLKRHNPGLRLVISYADPEQGHNGGIYQAGNWVYVGRSRPQSQLIVDGQPMHKRSATTKWGTASVERIQALSGRHVERSDALWKHTYLMPLDDAMRGQVTPLALPYPARPKGQAPVIQTGLGGSTPTRTLHPSEPDSAGALSVGIDG